MLFEIFGYIASSLIIAFLISWKLTSDIYPYRLKKFLIRIILQNWARKQRQTLVEYDLKHAKSTNDIGVVSNEDESRIEKPVVLQNFFDSDELIFYGIDETGNGIIVQVKRYYNDWVEASVGIVLDNKSYSISRSGKSSSSSEFCLGNLKLEMVEPMRIWRIWYNGVLNEELPETTANTNSVPVHAVINLLWKALDCPFDTRKDVNVHLMADYLARNGRFGERFGDLASTNILPAGYTQYGNLNGTIKIGRVDENEPQIIPCSTFYGIRQRQFVPTFKLNDDLSSIELFGYCDLNGNSFRISGVESGWTDGHILYASTKRNPVLEVDVESKVFLGSSTSLPKFFILTDQRASIQVEVWPKFSTVKFGDKEVIFLPLTLNAKAGHGVLIRKKVQDSFRNERIQRNMLIDQALQPKFDSNNHTYTSEPSPHVVPFDSVECQNVSLVGGKGASLAKLASLSKTDLGVGKFGTASGFCVTTSLFTSALDRKIIIKIFDGETNDVESASKKVIEYIKTSNAQELIRPHVDKMLRKLFEEEGNNARKLDQLRFAVRSSGTLEDMSELSCAGQNETFLNVGCQLVAEKVVDSWASLFAAQSVQYRLNHGQPIWCEMGVVVQEMVDAKSAGVMFTADPRTGSPFMILINGNFGLGESVVAGICTPDTYILKRSNCDLRELSILDKTLGMKNVTIVPDMENGLTKHLEMERVTTEYCLEDDTVLKLGEIGVEIEKNLGNLRPVDIEWAVNQNGNVIILQTRSMTSLDSWTDDEVIHEMDTPLRTNSEPLTTANAGEVMPMAVSPLGISITVRFFNAAVYALIPDRVIPHMLKMAVLNRQRLLLNMYTFFNSVDAEIGPTQAALELSVFGHRLDSKKYHELGKERFGIMSPFVKTGSLLGAVIGFWKNKLEIKRVIRKYGNYGANPEVLQKMKDPVQVYELISTKLFDLLEIAIFHCITSGFCQIANLITLIALASGQKVEEWGSSLYEDISKILAVGSNVESADISKSMIELADAIYEDKDIAAGFVNSSPENALVLLRNNRELNSALQNFMKKHGHRSYAELDIMNQPWQIDPMPLIKLVQGIVDNKIKYPDTNLWLTGSKFASDDEMLDSLNTQLSPRKRRFLKFMMKQCRTAVTNRETTKSLFMRALVAFKVMYNHLGSLLVRDHLLQDSKLVYFMTHYEIGLVIRRDPAISRILYKVMKRYKIYPELNKEEYPELLEGKFEPIEDDSTLQLGDSISATPLSTGKVQAIVKVCLSVDEASMLLEPGDILVTKGTDIAWSPFFPMLGGIVTELGGLISHGAVVAREYGLPCIVGAVNATKILKTGETVILDAGKGTVTKVTLSVK